MHTVDQPSVILYTVDTESIAVILSSVLGVLIIGATVIIFAVSAILCFIKTGLHRS